MEPRALIMFTKGERLYFVEVTHLDTFINTIMDKAYHADIVIENGILVKNRYGKVRPIITSDDID